MPCTILGPGDREINQMQSLSATVALFLQVREHLSHHVIINVFELRGGHGMPRKEGG